MNGADEPAVTSAAAGGQPLAARTEEVRKLHEKIKGLQKAADGAQAQASQREADLVTERTKAERAHVSYLSWMSCEVRLFRSD